MTLDVTAALVVFLAVPFGCGCVVDPFAGADRYLYVPDASPTAVPIEAPGLDLPYSSLDPTAPPKRLANGARVRLSA